MSGAGATATLATSSVGGRCTQSSTDDRSSLLMYAAQATTSSAIVLVSLRRPAGATGAIDRALQLTNAGGSCRV